MNEEELDLTQSISFIEPAHNNVKSEFYIMKKDGELDFNILLSGEMQEELLKNTGESCVLITSEDDIAVENVNENSSSAIEICFSNENLNNDLKESSCENSIESMTMENEDIECNEFIDLQQAVIKREILFEERNKAPHLSSDSIEESYICDVCRKYFSSKSSLSVHYGCHPQTSIHKCSICAETFVQATDYADHFAQHCIEIEYDCVMCNETFTDKSEFDAHNSIHFKELKENEFSEGDLLNYENKHNISPKQSYPCTLCDKTFQLKSSLNRHMLIHNSEKPFECEICHKGYTQKISLKKHYLMHKQIKPYNCELCPKSFTSKTSLELHYVNHSGERPYSCLVCDRSFTSKRNLKRHGLEHMPGQEGACKICGKVFNTKTKLHFHSLVHTNDRPYKCTQCDRGFTYSSHLKRHMLWHNNERPFVCDFCGKDFPARFRLVKHLKKHQSDLDFESFNLKNGHIVEATDIDDIGSNFIETIQTVDAAPWLLENAVEVILENGADGTYTVKTV